MVEQMLQAGGTTLIVLLGLLIGLIMACAWTGIWNKPS